MKRMSSPCPYCGELTEHGKSQCPGCRKWLPSSLGEMVFNDFDSIMLSDVDDAEQDRLKTGPWDVVWGGGMVKTSVTLLGGPPGAGKSTLMLMIADKCPGEPIYVAAEEALGEIKARAKRLKIKKDIRMVPALNGANVGAVLSKFKPSIVFIDSLQGLVGNDDALQEQVCKICKTHAVRLNCPIILVSHVTKQEVLAGKMTLQHTVDITMTFSEGDELEERVLTSIKNRNGPSHIECFFEMTKKGLVYLDNTED